MNYNEPRDDIFIII